MMYELVWKNGDYRALRHRDGGVYFERNVKDSLGGDKWLRILFVSESRPTTPNGDNYPAVGMPPDLLIALLQNSQP